MIETRFIRGQFRDGTFVDTTNLAEAMLKKPEIMDTVIFAFGSSPEYGGLGDQYTVLQYLTQGASGISSDNYEVKGSDEIYWRIMGNLQTTVPIAEDASLANRSVGIGFSNFKVSFPFKYFSLGFVCRFLDGTLARVISEPWREGDNWCYEFQIIGNDPNQYVHDWALRAGAEVAWDFTAYEEGSEGGGMVDATPSVMRNQMTITRLSYGMTGSAKTDVLWFDITNRATGDKARLWLYYQQFLAMKQWARQHERMLWNSRYNRLPDGTFANVGANGRPVKMGAGIEQQISGTNKIIASELTEEMLWHMTADIYAHSNFRENTRRVLITGAGGISEFHKALKKAGMQYQIVDTIWTQKGTGQKLTFGAQYTTYKGFMGTELTVVHHPMFDDRTIYPNTIGPYGYPDQSYKMFFLDFSDYDGYPNIQLISKGANGEDRRFIQWFTAGAVTPEFEGSSNTKMVMRSHGQDSFTCHMLSETGVIIRNPFSCGMIEVRPN